MIADRAFIDSLKPMLTGTADEIEDAVGALRSISLIFHCDHEQSCDAHDGGATLGWVICGTVRKYMIRVSGQRRIVDLLMAGDFFGFGDDENRRYSLQAIADGTCIARCSRPRMLALAALNPAIDRLLHERSHQAIARLENHVLAQGRTRAPEKVGAYLLSMARRIGSPSSAVMELPITRYDIADHLGLAVETVSRAITDLRDSGMISFEKPRQIAIVDSLSLSEGVG